MLTPTPRALRTRQKMFAATEQILSREGYAAWNEEYMCELCECSRGALRHQFPDGRYDLFPAYVDAVIAADSAMVESVSDLMPAERMYLFLASMQLRAPSPATRAILELSMAARGDQKMHDRVKPIMESANHRVLGVSAANLDPEMLALRHILHGASLYSFDTDYSAAHFQQSLKWLLAQLPVPAKVTARIDAMIKARQAFEQEHLK
jgi:hypothetical protein